MKPFDSKGEYTRAEVKDALAGVDGNLPFTYRYELLNEENDFVDEIDFVQSCTIDNNALADIKRTAKFDILDTGTINYLKHRIKPYIRLTMPHDETYSDTMVSLEPDVWWKLDDPTVAAAPAVKVTRATAVNYNTVATADFVDLTIENARAAAVQTGNVSLRTEYWSYVNAVPSRALQIQMLNTGSVNLLWEIYTAATLTDPLTLVKSTTMAAGADVTYSYPFPEKGIYISRMVSTSTTNCAATTTYYSSARLEDSSGNGVYGAGSGLTLGATAVLADGGKSMSTLGVARSFMTNNTNVTLKGGLSLNFWLNRTGNGNKITAEFGIQTGSFKLYLNDDAVAGTYVLVLTFTSYDTASYPNYTSTISVPSGMLSVGAKMVTISLNPSGSSRLFINGIAAGTFSSLAAYTYLFQTEYISYTYQNNYSTTTTYFDDLSIHSKGLTGGVVSNLYQKGLKASTVRSGYVEWPQGIFVLSSPTRTLVDGHYLHRDVEGYDQLVVLKEDSFDYRYSALANTYYTDAVKKVLQSASAVKKYTLANPIWSVVDGAVILSETSAQFNGTTTNNPKITTSNDAFAFGGLIVSGKFTKTTANSKMSLEVKIGPDTFTMYASTTGTIVANALNSDVWTATYSATTHAYWRIREVGGTIKFGYSSNGTTWTEPATSTPTSTTEAPVTVNTNLLAFAAPSGDKVEFLSVTAAPLMVSSITKSTKKLTTTMEWEVGTPKLQIINELLAAINYTSATYDEIGVFVAKPYVTPDKRTAEFSYVTDEKSVILGNVDQTIDLFKIPNKWVCVVSDPDRPALMGTYTNSNPLSPTSTVSRGRTIVAYVSEQGAPDQVTLDAQAARLAFEASQVYESIEFETSMMPIHQDADVYNVTIDGLSVNAKYAEHTWSMDLKNGSTMKHKIRKVVGL